MTSAPGRGEGTGHAGPTVTVRPPDPGLLDDVDERCLRVDRLLLQVIDCLNTALVELALSSDRRARNQVAAALSASRELRDEFGELGVDLLELRDAVNAGPRP